MNTSTHLPTFKTQHTQLSTNQYQLKQQPISYDQQFTNIYKEITQHQYFHIINKHQKIRINKWLTKLANISVNQVWKKNRNNYIKLIKLMFDCQVIIQPFLMMPPDRDLHKLTHHQIHVIINQVDRIVDQRQKSSTNRVQQNKKGNQVSWTQQSAYINHQQSQVSHRNRSIDKQSHQNRSIYNKSYGLSNITAATNFAQSHLIPPKHPSTKTKTLSKQSVLQQINSPKANQLIKLRQKDERSPTAQYFTKKQRYHTFETQDFAQEDQREINFQQKQKQALFILKCGFKMLDMIPKSQLQSSHKQVQFIQHQQINILKSLIRNNQFLNSQFNHDNQIHSNLNRNNQIHSNLNHNNQIYSNLNHNKQIHDNFNQNKQIFSNQNQQNYCNLINRSTQTNIKSNQTDRNMNSNHQNTYQDIKQSNLINIVDKDNDYQIKNTGKINVKKKMKLTLMQPLLKQQTLNGKVQI